MNLIDPVVFGWHCRDKGMVSGNHNRDRYCDLFLDAVLPALQLAPPTNVPPAAVGARHPDWNLGGLDRMQALPILSRGPGVVSATHKPIVICVAGEDHSSAKDQARGADLLTKAVSIAHPILVVLERGLERTHSGVVANPQNALVGKEWDMIGGDGTELQRSVVLACFIYACLAGGDQSRKSRVLLMIGDNHVDDACAALEYLIVQQRGCVWVAYRPRMFQILRTFARGSEAEPYRG